MSEDREFGHQIKEWRIAKGLTQQGLAKGARCCKTVIARLEAGQGYGGSVETCVREFMESATEEVISRLRMPGQGKRGKRRPQKQFLRSMQPVMDDGCSITDFDEEIESLQSKF